MAVFCVDCLEEALHSHGKPEIFNSDQGSQLTSEVFTGALKREGIAISMDGRGRARQHLPFRSSTTMIYTHVLNRGGKGVFSPLDRL